MSALIFSSIFEYTSQMDTPQLRVRTADTKSRSPILSPAVSAKASLFSMFIAQLFKQRVDLFKLRVDESEKLFQAQDAGKEKLHQERLIRDEIQLFGVSQFRRVSRPLSDIAYNVLLGPAPCSKPLTSIRPPLSSFFCFRYICASSAGQKNAADILNSFLISYPGMGFINRSPKIPFSTI